MAFQECAGVSENLQGFIVCKHEQVVRHGVGEILHGRGEERAFVRERGFAAAGGMCTGAFTPSLNKALATTNAPVTYAIYNTKRRS